MKQSEIQSELIQSLCDALDQKIIELENKGRKTA